MNLRFSNQLKLPEKQSRHHNLSLRLTHRLQSIQPSLLLAHSNQANVSFIYAWQVVTIYVESPGSGIECFTFVVVKMYGVKFGWN
jgi:hypothetical protein